MWLRSPARRRLRAPRRRGAPPARARASRWVADAGSGNSDHREFGLAGLTAAKLGVPDDPRGTPPPTSPHGCGHGPSRGCAALETLPGAESRRRTWRPARLRPYPERRARGRHDPLRGEPHPARAGGPRARRDPHAAPALRARPLGRAARGPRASTSVDAHGKHLFLRFEGGLTIHSHLRMTGSWRVLEPGRRWPRSPRRAWLVLRRGDREVVQFNGPVLELMTEGRTRFDQRLAALGPDILAPELRRRRASCAACATTTRRARSATRCSTSARSRASATCGRPRAASRRASIRGGRPGRCPTPRRWRSSTRAGRACSSRRSTATRRRFRRVYGRAGLPCPRCGPLARSAARAGGRQPPDLLVPAMSDVTPAPRRPQGRRPHRAGQHARLVRRRARRARRHDRVRRAAARTTGRAGTSRLVLAHDYAHVAARRADARAGARAPGVARVRRRSSSTSTSSCPGYERRVVEALRRHGLVERTLVSTHVHAQPRRAARARAAAAARLVGAAGAARLHGVPAHRRSRPTAARPQCAGGCPRDRRRPRARRALRRADGALAARHAAAGARRVREAGGDLYVWTVDDAARIRALEALGVTGVITNDPRLFGT